MHIFTWVALSEEGEGTIRKDQTPLWFRFPELPIQIF